MGDDPDKTDMMSVFSDCEEVRDSDEAGINILNSQKKPYASRMVLSHKEQYDSN